MRSAQQRAPDHPNHARRALDGCSVSSMTVSRIDERSTIGGQICLEKGGENWFVVKIHRMKEFSAYSSHRRTLSVGRPPIQLFDGTVVVSRAGRSISWRTHARNTFTNRYGPASQYRAFGAAQSGLEELRTVEERTTALAFKDLGRGTNVRKGSPSSASIDFPQPLPPMMSRKAASRIPNVSWPLDRSK